MAKLAVAIFTFQLIALTAVRAEESSVPWRWSFGIGPNLTQLDAVDDELGSSYGAAIWATKKWDKQRRLDLSFDYFDFAGSDTNYPAISALYGWQFRSATQNLSGRKWGQPFFLVGGGVGQANSFPRAVDTNQTAIHFKARVGVDELLYYKNWSVGLIFDFLHADLDGKQAESAQLGLPMLFVTYTGNNKQTTVVQNQPVDTDRDGVFDHKDECPGTPIGTKVNSIGCAKEVKIKKVLRVEFETAKAQILEKYLVVIDEFAQFLNENPDLEVTIEGHTDSVGKRDYNLKLSKARARSVREALIKRGGVTPSRVKAKGFGPDRPDDTNETPEGRSRNRRVMAVIGSS